MNARIEAIEGGAFQPMQPRAFTGPGASTSAKHLAQRRGGRVVPDENAKEEGRDGKEDLNMPTSELTAKESEARIAELMDSRIYWSFQTFKHEWKALEAQNDAAKANVKAKNKRTNRWQQRRKDAVRKMLPFAETGGASLRLVVASDELSAVFHELYRLCWYSLGVKEREGFRTTRCSGRSANQPSIIAPFNFGIDGKWWEEKREAFSSLDPIRSPWNHVRDLTKYLTPKNGRTNRYTSSTKKSKTKDVEDSEVMVMKLVLKTKILTPRILLEFEHARGCYVVLEYIEGRTLAEAWASILSTQKEFVIETLRDYRIQLRTICDDHSSMPDVSFHILWDRPVPLEQFNEYLPLVLVHNDLNMENIMLGTDGRVWLLD
ncbi:hypothetical protein BD410DRAFT_844066 [Rickenella mellea]|uniref:Aminoglycoside phosphotransferase domain-containing protein n=1 Tax=Rickenella mellea TaxID=50990 RepID=A0A4Y7PQU9_9AGAM|nr:hypothetical protein BD410DRAFT_844066 [Rickenella mellea]